MAEGFIRPSGEYAKNQFAIPKPLLLKLKVANGEEKARYL